MVVVGVDEIEVDDEDEDKDVDDDEELKSVVSRPSKFSESPPFISNTKESSLK